MPDFSEVMDARAAAPAGPGAPSPQALMALLRESQRGAAVLTELLDSPAWNVFRSTIGGALESAEAERAVLRERMEAGEVVGDDRARSELRLQYLRGKVEALRLAMELPKQLIDRHDKLETLAGRVHPNEDAGRVHANGEQAEGGDAIASARAAPRGHSTAAPVVTSAAGAAKRAPAPVKPRRRRRKS